MFLRRRNWLAAGLLTVVLAGFLLAMPTAGVQKKPNLDKIPKIVMDALKARFHKAEIDKWSKEKEGGIVIYDFEFKQEGQKFEADIKEDGTIHNWEREISVKDLPEIVRKAVEAKYSKATLKEIMAITAVTDGKEELEGYEILLETVRKREIEVTVAPDGKFLEGPGVKR
jgi:preprotein translocase subunit SecD